MNVSLIEAIASAVSVAVVIIQGFNTLVVLRMSSEVNSLKVYMSERFVSKDDFDRYKDDLIRKRAA